MIMPMIGQMGNVREALPRWFKHVQSFPLTHGGKSHPEPPAPTFALIRLCLKNSLPTNSTTTINKMSLFTRESDTDDGINWDNTPFTRTVELQSKCSDSIEKYTERGASRLYRELTAGRETTLQEVQTSWFDVESIGYNSTELYFIEVGPIVATADGVTWNRAFTMEDEAPEFKSERWKEVAREFQLTARDEEIGVGSVITSAYNTLEEATKLNDGFRAMHETELRRHTPAVTNRSFKKAMECLAEWDGVNGPTDGPAWVYTEEPELSDTYEQGSKSENAEIPG